VGIFAMKKTILGLAAAAAAISGFAPPATAATPVAGVWRNPKNTVHVKLQPCGATMCGTVVWAAPKAQAKARAAGQKLVGAQLFREFRAIGPGRWEGKVFVPDLNRTFSGTMTAAGPARMVGKGCLIGGFFCKSQTWVKIG
jgi:uncharacterized protein (DUF2147 family)